MKVNSDRRDFIKKAALLTGAAGIAGSSAFAFSKSIQNSGNPLPKWKGFNLLDFFSPDPNRSYGGSTEEDFKWMADWGFDFVRIPMAYPAYLDIDRSRDITPEEVFNINEEAVERVDRLVYMAHKYKLHVNINLHRVPGYCINAGFHEPYNLWKDREAQKAFYWHWNMWAERYKNISRERISFDLLNEPAMIEEAANTIWKQNPDHLVIADGNQIGTRVISEITHLSREMLEKFYEPWIKLAQSGTGVHCGECGSYNKTPHDIFLAWFGDVVDILSSNDIGFALWNFRGDFGILDSGRQDVDYEEWYGHKLDRKLVGLIRKA